MTTLERLNVAECYQSNKGVWPSELDVSGVMFWRGQRIVKADFRAIKKDGMESARFAK